MDFPRLLRSDALRVLVAAAVGSAVIPPLWSAYVRRQAVVTITAAETRAMERHNATMALFDQLDDDQAKADALENDALPLWQAALRVADEHHADLAAKRLHLRVISTEYLIDALRTGDQSGVDRARAAWAKAEASGRHPKLATAKLDR